MNDVDNRNRQQNIKLIRSRSLGVAVTQVVFGIGLAGVIYFAGIESLNGDLSPGSFMSFFGAMMLMLQPIRRITNVNAILQRGIAASNSLFSVMDQPIEKDEGTLEKTSSEGSLEYRKVCFSYQSKDNRNTISDISFSAKKGESIAIVGHSGSGKSTMINLLPRFYDPQEGEICIDDQDIKKINLNSLRRKISLVSQDVILFDETIKYNIAYADPMATQKDVEEACKFAAADEFIDKLPEKYNTLVGENGVRLSGGQKQRISIARAILKKSPIILLDEATSSLDTESERVVQNAINNLIKGRTTIVIAHRLSTILNSDVIYVIDKGQVIDHGKHDELLKSSETYKNFYDKQLRKS